MRKKRNKETGREKETEQLRSLAPGRAFQSVQSSVSSLPSVHRPGIILYTGSPCVATRLHGRRSRGAEEERIVQVHRTAFSFRDVESTISFLFLSIIHYFIFSFLSYLLTNWTVFDFLFFLFSYLLFSEKSGICHFLRFQLTLQLIFDISIFF